MKRILGLACLASFFMACAPAPLYIPPPGPPRFARRIYVPAPPPPHIYVPAPVVVHPPRVVVSVPAPPRFIFR